MPSNVAFRKEENMQIESFLTHFKGVEEYEKGIEWVCYCPAHNDSKPSLYIRLENDRFLLKCFAGCSTEQVVEAVGLECPVPEWC